MRDATVDAEIVLCCEKSWGMQRTRILSKGEGGFRSEREAGAIRPQGDGE